MTTYELNTSRLDNQAFGRADVWKLIAREAWDPQSQSTEDDTGRYKVRINDKGTPVYFKDDKDEWESKDGKHWTRKGSRGTDSFDGSVKVDKDGSIIVTNDDTGVTFKCQKDGTTTCSISTADGVEHSITRDSTGKQICSKIGNKEWKTADGGKTWQSNGGPVWEGTLAIDRFGQYREQAKGGEEKTVARSKELKELIDKQEQLEKDWGIKIIRPGEKVRYGGTDYECHSPTKAELKTLETVLYRNQQMNFKNVKLAFVQSGKNTDGTSLWGAYQRHDAGGQVVLMPKHTEAKGWNALEGTLEHELVHHEQYENWGSNEWGATGAPEFTKELNSKMGWRYDTANSRYIISDNAGKEYVRINGSWVPLVDGKPNVKQAISNDAMHKIAKVRPSTTYFTNPGEMHAEGMAMFRMERRMLFNESPQMYDICKEWDQQLIDKRFGKTDGKSKYIRNEKGEIVEATAENRDTVRKAEERWQRENNPAPRQDGNRFHANDGKADGKSLANQRAQCEHCVEMERRSQRMQW